MGDHTAAFLGEFSADRVPWDQLGRHIGWTVKRVSDLQALSRLHTEASITAVFVDWDAHVDDGQLLLGRIHELVPEARLIVCYPLARPILAEELVEMGAFHSVPRPLDVGEVQQSLGFIWEAWSRSVEPGRAGATGQIGS